MKQYLLSLFLTITSVTGFSQIPGAWYKTFTGKVGNMDAVMHLASTIQYTGYIWFRQNQYPIDISGNLLSGDSIRLHSTDGVLSITLEGILSKSLIKGQAVLDLTTDNQPAKKASFSLYEDSSYTQFQELYAKTETTLPKKLNNASAFFSYRATVWPKDKTTFSDSIKKLIVRTLQLKNNENVTGQMKSKCLDESKQWVSENLRLFPKDASEMGLSLTVETRDVVNIMYEDERVITLACFTFAYTGGAHGNYGTTLYTIDKRTGESIRPEDILSEEGLKRLPQILDASARAQFKVKKGSLLDNGFLVAYIPVSRSFYITGTGIGFLYNPYEIMPFSAGQVNLMVPFNALSTYLKPGFKS